MEKKPEVCKETVDAVAHDASASPLLKISVQTSAIHCPYRQATLLQQALAPDKMRVAFLLGAGCPMAIHISEGKETRPLIPDIAGLSSQVRNALQSSKEYKGTFGIIIKRLADIGKNEPNVEEILSHVRSLHDVVGNGKIDGLSKLDLAGLDKNICKHITDVVKVNLPSDNTPYHRLASWIGGIQRAHPIEIFTPNYDLLLDQALEDRRVPYFDGFVGSCRTFFDITSIEQDNLPARWARLWKVHGSFNWWRTLKGDIERRIDGEEGDRQMIYPSHLKYDQSRRMPYLAMLDRLKSFLARGQAVLVTSGYSFSDQHLNETVIQGLSSNPTAICFGMLFGDRAKSPEAVASARKQPNLSLLAADGAILGTIERDWRSDEKQEHPQHGLAAQCGEMKPRSDAPADRCKFLLGDFNVFSEVLARQLAQDETNGGV
jgi:hypothetical protein